VRTRHLKNFNLCAQNSKFYNLLTKNKEQSIVQIKYTSAVVSPYRWAYKSSQRSVLSLILMDVFRLRSAEVWSPPLVVAEWGKGIRMPLFYKKPSSTGPPWSYWPVLARLLRTTRAPIQLAHIQLAGIHISTA
jgi:hypothetical protein